MRKKFHPTIIELVNHNPTSISYYKINYCKPTQIRLTGTQQRKKEVYQKEEEGKEKDMGKEAVRKPWHPHTILHGLMTLRTTVYMLVKLFNQYSFRDSILSNHVPPL
jgi:hypothetical protein